MPLVARMLVMTACLSGAVAVALGAFAAHGLAAIRSAELVAVFNTGVSYQFYHSLALLLAGVLAVYWSSRWLILSGVCFTTGIICFSGSLYLYVLSGLKWLGPITPIGGVCFMLGWILLSVAVLRGKRR